MLRPVWIARCDSEMRGLACGDDVTGLQLDPRQQRPDPQLHPGHVGRAGQLQRARPGDLRVADEPGPLAQRAESRQRIRFEPRAPQRPAPQPAPRWRVPSPAPCRRSSAGSWRASPAPVPAPTSAARQAGCRRPRSRSRSPPRPRRCPAGSRRAARAPGTARSGLLGLLPDEAGKPPQLLDGLGTCPLSAALSADLNASLPRLMPPSFSGSGTRSQSDSAWSKCRCASAGAASRHASCAGRPPRPRMRPECRGWPGSGRRAQRVNPPGPDSSSANRACSLLRSPGSKSL